LAHPAVQNKKAITGNKIAFACMNISLFVKRKNRPKIHLLIFKPGGIGRSGKWSISFYTSACYCINGQGHIKRFRTDGRALIWAPVIKIANG